MYEILFDLNINMCEAFPALDPFKVRAQRFHDVLLIFRRLNEKADKKSKTEGVKLKDGTIRRPAKDDSWY